MVPMGSGGADEGENVAVKLMGDVLPSAGLEAADELVVYDGDFLVSLPTVPPILARVRRLGGSSASCVERCDGEVPASRLVVRLRTTMLPFADATMDLERRGDDDEPRPSSLRIASDAPESLETSTPSCTRSRVWRRIEAAIIDGED